MIVAVQSKSGQRQWKLVDEAVHKKQRKQRLHREEMVQFRLRKKLQETKLRTQHRQLEREMERHVAAWKAEAAKGLCNANTIQFSSGGDADGMADGVQHQARELVLESEALRVANARLREAIASHGKWQERIYSEADRLVADDRGSVLGEEGWRVTFADGAPSFHFYPFSKEESTANLQKYDAVLDEREVVERGGFTEIGALLGWRVERAPLARHVSGKWMTTRVRLSKQIHCVAGASGATMDELEAQSWPVLTTPELCPRVHRANSTSLKLQELDNDTVVTVSNSPQHSRGRHLRYLNMIQRGSSADEQGRRTVKYAMVIPDSNANKVSREAENSRQDVLWVSEGAAYMTLSQMDDSTLQVTYDNYSGCKNELHARHLLVEWGHEAVRWELLVTPSRLLAM